MGCGLGMPFRKGADLFIEVARRLQQRGQHDLHLYWVVQFPADEQDAVHGLWADHLYGSRLPTRRP